MVKFYNEATEYSDKYYDSVYEYRHVVISMNDFEKLPRDYRSYYDANNRDRKDQEASYLATSGLGSLSEVRTVPI